jgi:hypothetical protein
LDLSNLQIRIIYPADHTIFVKTGDCFQTGSYSKSKGTNGVVDGKLSMDFNKKFGAHTLFTTRHRYRPPSSSTVVKVPVYPMIIWTNRMANGYE